MSDEKKVFDVLEENIEKPKNTSRRKAVKTIVGSVGAITAYHMMPVNWSTPIIEQIFLPAHAAVSGLTLSDPCQIILISGDQTSVTVQISVSGSVSPPTGDLPVSIVVTPNGGSGGPVTVPTETADDGAFGATVTLTGGPGILGVAVVTSVSGASEPGYCTLALDKPSSGGTTTTAAPTTTAPATTGPPTTPAPTTPAPTTPAPTTPAPTTTDPAIG